MKTELIVLAPSRPPSGEVAQRIAGLLAKGDHETAASPDDAALYGDLFTRVPNGWPAAAFTRQFDAGDGSEYAWLRGDPAHFRVEPGNVRLVACGDLGQDAAEVAALLAALAPLFGDEGFELSAPHPARWYLRAFPQNAAPDLPSLPPPEAALGGDLFELWPEDDIHRRWRGLFNQAQILLAHHPVNRARVRGGRPAINGLWFWGAGRLPRQVRADGIAVAISDDALLGALAKTARIPLLDSWPERTGAATTILLDLRRSPDAEALLARVLAEWDAGRLARVHWRAPGARWNLKRRHRWRFWRR